MMTKPKSKPAFLIAATHVVDPVDAAAFESIAARMAEAAHRRTGNTFLHAAQDVLEPSTFHLTEGWASQEAFEEHLHSDEFQAVLKEALALRIVERSGTMYFVAGLQMLEMPV